MEDAQTLPEICCLKNSDILVHVEEALLDFIVVSYEYDSRLYQGVLLDASNRALPCGIFPPSGIPDLDTAQHGLGTDEDRMHSVAQRYTYFQGKSPPQLEASSKDGGPPGAAYHLRRAICGGQSKFKNSRMTVRLRPRQVLCSKCKSICNENSENVDLSKKRKGEESSGSSDGPVDKRNCRPRQISPKSPRPPFSENPQDKSPNALTASGRKKTSSPPEDSSTLRSALIAKSAKSVKESERMSPLNSNENKKKIVGGFWTGLPNDQKLEEENNRSTSMLQAMANGRADSGPSVMPADDFAIDSIKSHSMEVLEPTRVFQKDVKTPEFFELDAFNVQSKSENSIDEQFNNQDDSSAKLNSSFASSEADESQDRMVLRKKRNVGSMEDLWDESVFLEDTTRRTTPIIKISFGTQGEGTVLKIPAKVRSFHDSESEAEDPEACLPEIQTKDARAKAAKRALKRAKKEARRKVSGASSPSRSMGGNSPAYESTLYHRRRKRKVKHKKRHKEMQHISTVEEEVDLDVPPLLDEDPLKIDKNMPDGKITTSPSEYEFIKEKCLKQKLSINLKRLNATAYTHCGEMSPTPDCDSPGSNSETSGGDELPDFPRPPPDHALVTVGSCLTSDGRTVEVGDVVWGKIHGFPWWPGKVLSITIKKKEDGVAFGPQAHVAWYGSSTSSLMPCDQLSPFLETFKTRYNKKKRGPYKEAIRQATCEARKSSPDPLQEIDVVS